MREPRQICVYCGASSGTDPAYALAARALGQCLAERDIGLVYGGGQLGLMGTLAQAVLDHGGRVTGVIPQALQDREMAHRSLTQLHVVSNMHERKAMMTQLADAFIAMPGGLGTLEELFEMWTWLQLGFHQKPLGLFNVLGFYDGLLAFVAHQRLSGFVRPEHADMLLVDTQAASLVQGLMQRCKP